MSGAHAFRSRGGDPAPPPVGDPDVYAHLLSWVKSNAEDLGLDPKERVQVHGFHATFRISPDGELLVEVVAQFTQKEDTSEDARFAGLPFRGGATVVASVDGTVRFVIAKPMNDARRERQVDFVQRCDLRDPALPWASESYLRVRARRDFRALHQGLVA